MADRPRSPDRLRVAAAEACRARVARRRHGGARPRRPRRAARAPGARAVHVAAARRAAGDISSSGGASASRAIRALHRLVELHDWQHNLFFLILVAAVHVGHARGVGDRGLAPRARPRTSACGSTRSASSRRSPRSRPIASSIPDDPFPEIVEPSGPRRAGIFDGRGARPSAAARGAQRCATTCASAAPTQLLVVSGSNMSGKSTLLRTVGINAVLALAGAPVRAQSLRLSPLAIGATLRIQDSLQEGRSRFYAEITRIREIADLARGPRAAAVPARRAVSRHQLARPARRRVGRAAQPARSRRHRPDHDARSGADGDRRRRSAPRAANVHFEDWFDGGEMRFDYR